MNIPNRKAKAVKERFQEENNTLKRVVRDDANDKKKGDILEVELGDAKQPDFKPQAKIKRWKNEVNFSLRRKKNWKNPNVRTESIETGAKVKVQDDDEELHMYELDGFEDGGLEVETILKKKPKGKNANQIEFTLETKGLDFFYQPELTQEEKDNGAKRPENVVGSYAAYHKTNANNEYKTGKAFHIYRPHITDADGNETWGGLDIDEENGLLTVTVPRKFLAQAVYPVVVDPTFGYETIGASSENIAISSFGPTQSYRIGVVFSPGSSGNLDEINAAIDDDTSSDVNFAFSINEKDSSGSGSHGEVSSVDFTNTQLSSTSSFITGTVSGSVSGGTEYVLNAIGDYNPLNSSEAINFSYDSATTETNYREGTENFGDYSALKNEDPWNVSKNTRDRKYSIYATYTASPSASTVTTSSVTNKTNTSGDGNGEITDTGGADASERGFVYDTSSQTDPGDTSPANSSYSSVENETGTFGTGTFSLTMSGLSSGTTYYVRAYAENSEGYSYGSEVQFTTNTASTVSLNDITSIKGATSINL